MNRTVQIIIGSIGQAFHELRANKLRTILSLTGITIGIFCIIAVLTVLDSMKNNIEKEMSSLGSDVIYVGRWPWMDEGGEYKWWEFWRRPSMSVDELRAVQAIPTVSFATLCYRSSQTIKYLDQELEGVEGYAVTPHFDKIQNIEMQMGRYLSISEMEGGTNNVVLGYEVYDELFYGNRDPIGKHVNFLGRKFNIIGVMKKVGQNMAGFNFDRGYIYPYYAAASLKDVTTLNSDPMLIVKAASGNPIDEVRYEVEGALRRVRKVRPGEANNFAINQLSQISERLDIMFATINVIGSVIGGFSLIVGAFGIANIMFVTVKERTKIIGLKKALGAKPNIILTEFLAEAVALCIAGGIIGIVVVLLLSAVLTYALDFPVTLSFQNFIVGISISAAVGVLAGFIPARSAARLDPVVAIRSN